MQLLMLILYYDSLLFQIWTPTASVPSIVAAGPAGPENDNVLDVMESNQRRLCSYQEMVL